MIKIILKNGSSDISFKLGSQIEERDFVDKSKTLGGSYQIRVGDQKYKISDIQDIYFEFDDRFKILEKLKTTKKSVSGEDLAERLKIKDKKQREAKVKMFEGGVRSKMGFVPKDNLVYQQCLSQVRDSSDSSEIPLYVDFFVNSYKQSK